MKIDGITTDNRTKAFAIDAGGATWTFPFALLRHAPEVDNRIVDVYADEELGREGFTYRLADGSEDTIPMDAVLEYNQDPAHLAELLLYRLTGEALEALEESGLSRRELIRRLGTSPAQFYRLLDPTNTSKSVGQMLALLHLLGREVDVRVSRRAGWSGRPARAPYGRRNG